MIRPVVFTLILALSAVLASYAQDETPARQTSLEDQTDVAITVYNNNLALVRDRRDVSLADGEVTLTFMDVAQQIKPETVSIKSLSNPGAIRILEQNYEFDLISPSKLMEKYVGKEVQLRSFSSESTFTTEIATLLSVNERPVYQVGDAIHLGHPGSVVLPEIPDNLIAKPSLIWMLDSGDANQSIEATYLTSGIQWSADYVLTMNKEETTMDIAGWVTLVNQSGAQYTDAKLKIVAGDVNIVQPDLKAGGVAGRALAMEAAAMPDQESFAEYHLYTIPRRTTIKQNQSKQVSLLGADGVKVAKLYEFRGEEYFHSQRMPQALEQKVSAFLKFRNDEANALGIPLPAGTMRVYQEDSEGMLQFAGEDRIEHTPKDEYVRLRLGSAFDVVGERVQKDFTKIANNVIESEYEITLRNHKESDITVDVVEPMPGDWQVLNSSHDHTKPDARTAVFSIPVEADGEVVLTYRVRVRF
jgi:hypothetical protein